MIKISRITIRARGLSRLESLDFESVGAGKTTTSTTTSESNTIICSVMLR